MVAVIALYEIKVGIGSSFVCCGDRQGNLRLWRSKSKNELIKIKAHKEEVLAMDVKVRLFSKHLIQYCVIVIALTCGLSLLDIIMQDVAFV